MDTFALPALGWVDWALIAVLGVSVLAGLVRGFTFELMSLAGWVVAYFAAQWALPYVLPHVGLGLPGSPLQQVVALVLCFVVALITWSLLARLVRMLIRATPLTLPDRALGAVFGLLRGAVVLLVLATCVALTPASQSQPWQASAGARWLDVAVQSLKPLLPPEMARWLPA